MFDGSGSLSTSLAFQLGRSTELFMHPAQLKAALRGACYVHFSKSTNCLSHDSDKRYPMTFGPGWRGPCTVPMLGWVLDLASPIRGKIVAGLSGMHTASWQEKRLSIMP